MAPTRAACIGWFQICHLISKNIVGNKFTFLLFLFLSFVFVQAVALVGEFNNWDPQAEHWASRNNFGVWQLFLPDSADGASAIPHRCTPTAAAAKHPRGKHGQGGGVGVGGLQVCCLEKRHPL